MEHTQHSNVIFKWPVEDHKRESVHRKLPDQTLDPGCTIGKLADEFECFLDLINEGICRLQTSFSVPACSRTQVGHSFIRNS